MSERDWDESYRKGVPPWDPGDYDAHLPRVLADHRIVPGRALDIGCGEGKSALYLAGYGFTCTGIDVAPSAIETAKSRAAESGILACDFRVASFPEDAERPDDGYDFIMDRGLFHILREPTDTGRYLDKVCELLAPKGVYYTLMAKLEGATDDGGPPKWTEDEVRSAFEPKMQVRELRADRFFPRDPDSMPGWVVVAGAAE